MAASSTDKLRKGTNNFSTTLSGAIGSGDTTLSLASTTNLPTDTAIDLVIDRVDSSGNLTPSTREYIKGVVSGTNIISVSRGQGNSTAQAHNTGAVVECVFTHEAWNDHIDNHLLGHNQDGTHVSNLPLTTPQITTGLKDTNGATWIGQTATSSAVNYVNNTNAATGTDPSLAPAGTDSAIGLNLRGKGLGKTVNIGKGAVNIFPYDYVASGCVWSGDSYGSTRNGSMTSGVVVINGNPITVASVSAHTFTASKDTYVDVLDNGDGTGLLVYTEATNNAASPALASNSIRIAIIITGASSIANSGSVNQGQETMVLPIASSVPYAVTDSLGNLICPRDPQRKLLGYRIITGNVALTGPTSTTAVTGLTCPVIVPTGRKVKISAYTNALANSAGTASNLAICLSSAADANRIQQWNGTGSTTGFGALAEVTVTPASTSVTYVAGASAASGNVTVSGNSIIPAFIKVELV